MCSGLPAACGIPDYRFVDQPTNNGGASGVERPRCATNADCAKYTNTKVCDIVGGHCVECVSSTDASASSCAKGLFCNVNRCSVGCADDTGCADGLSCDLATHQCRGCTSDLDCPSGTACQDASCIPSCAGDIACPSGLSCCNGVCANLGSDPLHCDSCDKACADRQDCINGSCGEGSGCATGFGDCDGKLSTGCETNLSSDQKHCGSCLVDCTPAYCNGGTCSDIDCAADTADCDHIEATGCETLLTQPDNCGVCSNKCNDFNGTPACVDKKCTITCNAGFKDCDKNADTGCEIDLSNDSDNCGACGVVCVSENGRNVCVDGVCTPTCNTGFADCDGKPENGCEADLQTSTDYCGACDTPCLAADNATATCLYGVCTSECQPGFENCNGKAEDGCEADLSAPGSCGKCGVVCGNNGGTATCSAGVCGITCKKGFADCNERIEDGCEVDTTTSAANCGGCGSAFTCTSPTAQGSAACVNSKCVFTSCTAPFADCNGDTTCETNLNTDAKHCGLCGQPCYFPNATALCANKACVLDKCSAGFADCTTALGCETQLGSVTNCTKCGEVCTNEHGNPGCGSKGCEPTCAVGWGDCDGKPENGCETRLNVPGNCGVCGGGCQRANATTSCATGTCEITGCAAGYGNCDNELPTPNGCEAALTSLSNCGACNKACDFPNASESCSSGTCTQGACTAGYADCSSTLPGCETQLGSASNCSSCGDLCQTTNTHVTQNVCTGTVPAARCTPTCQPGFASCNGNPSDGCETDITTTSNCGACFAACSLPNAATYTCASGTTCTVATCQAGYANCNTSQTDGCERAVSGDIANCGGCNVACSSNHGTPSCTSGVCATACSAGYGNCNNNASDGCELATTNDANNCGACNAKCTGSTPFCVGTACRAHLTIGVETPVSGFSLGTANISLSHTLKNDSSRYRTVVAVVTGRGNNTSGKPSAVKYGSLTMKLEKEVPTSNQVWSGIYTLPNAVLPAPNVPTTVLVSPGSSTGNTFSMIASVFELTNVEQSTSFIDGLGGTAHNQCGATLTDNVITATDGALVVGVVAFYNGFTSAGTGSGQTVFLPAQVQDGLGAIAGYVVPGAPQPTPGFAFSWTPDNCAASSQSIVAFKPAVTP
ncbi:MAG: hypothetical protein QM756_12005 [Polyangiaceae bacterium]